MINIPHTLLTNQKLFSQIKQVINAHLKIKSHFELVSYVKSMCYMCIRVLDLKEALHISAKGA